MGTLTAVQQRQRAAPPFNRERPRRTPQGAGGPAARGKLLTANAQIENEVARFPGTTNDQLVAHDRNPWYDRDSYVPPGVSWISWTAAGPVRPSLHMRQATNSMYQGNSASRFPTANTPTGGLHSASPSGPSGTPMTAPRFVNTPQMRAARIDRLTTGQYAGQSFSGTTAMQGRAGRAR